MGEHRKKRVSELLREFLGKEIGRCGDPRLGSVTVTGVDMSNDLKTAWVYWAVHPDTLESVNGASDGSGESTKKHDEYICDTEGALKGASKLLRRRVGEGLKLRYTPNLHFKHDDSLARGLRIDHLLDCINLEGRKSR